MASGIAIEKLSASLSGGLNFGLETYLPKDRLLPGQTLRETPDHGQHTLTLVSDEGPDVKLAAAFLGAVGARTRFEKDFSHRYDNCYNQAIAHAGYSPVLAKGTFLSRVGTGPWGSAKNAAKKAEMFEQFCQLASHEDSLLKDKQSDFLFDQNASFFYTEDVAGEMMASEYPAPDRLSEGIETKRFFSFVKKWKEVDQGWTLEYLALDSFFKSGAKVNPEWIEGPHI